MEVKTNKKNSLHYYFRNKSSISIREIAEFFKKENPAITANAIHSRIRRMIKSGKLYRVGRGMYSFSQKKDFKPIIENIELEIFQKLKAEFPFLKLCIWNTRILNSFMLHQTVINNIIVEVESDADLRTMHSQAVFNYLKMHYKNIYHQPSASILDNYVLEQDQSIIVLPLVSEAPVQIIDEIATITLEKMLVDIFCNQKLFIAQQGNEMNTIFKEAQTRFRISEAKLFRYASRRGKKKYLREYIKQLNQK